MIARGIYTESKNKTEKNTSKTKPINITFRDTEKDILIYNEIIKHSSKGGFIKDLVYSKIMSDKNNKKEGSI